MHANKNAADYVLISNNIFTGMSSSVINGFVAIKDSLIVNVGPKEDRNQWIGPDTKIYDLEDMLVTPGFHDNHTFFTGSMILNKGLDLSNTTNHTEALNKLIRYSESIGDDEIVLAFGYNAEKCEDSLSSTALDQHITNKNAVIFHGDRDYCWFNTNAKDKFKMTSTDCSNESMHLLFRELLKNRDNVIKEFKEYMYFLNSRGVTSVKEIFFDDSLGLLEIINDMENKNELNVRVNFSLQPNAEPINIEFGLHCKEIYNNDFLRFQGFKFMTDGEIINFEGDLLEPYSNNVSLSENESVNYSQLKKDVDLSNNHGIKCCIHAEGDRALRKSIDILEESILKNGGNDLRHSIANLELSHPADLVRMGKNNIIAEIYSQILLLHESEKSAYMSEFGGMEREPYFYNYGCMEKEGVILTIGTDFPLMEPSVPDSIFAAHWRQFPDGLPESGWYREKGLSIHSIIKAWTSNAAYHNFMDDKLGTIEKGKLADIAVIDKNIFNTSAADVRDADVVLTFSNGREVYNNL